MEGMPSDGRALVLCGFAGKDRQIVGSCATLTTPRIGGSQLHGRIPPQSQGAFGARAVLPSGRGRRSSRTATDPPRPAAKQ